MRTAIKATNINHTAAVDGYVDKKLSELDKLLHRKDMGELARVELGKLTKHHRSGKVFFAEVTIHLKRKDLRATGEGNDLYEAIDKMQAMILREVKRHYQSQRTRGKAGGRELKRRIARGQ